jgi:gluconolactonase
MTGVSTWPELLQSCETQPTQWNRSRVPRRAGATTIQEVYVRSRTRLVIIAIATAAVVPLPRLIAQHAVRRPIDGRPNAIIDLRTPDGLRLVNGQWRYSDTTIVAADFNAPGPDLKPSGKPITTYDYMPKAGSADFDDSKWEAVDPAALEMRRSTGKLCFNWYRTRITIPEKVGTFETAGATVVFEIVVDDYAEIWVDGKLPRVLGQTGGALVKGFNAPNRVVLTNDARPGQTIQLAILGVNGPLSDPPSNFIWVRSATLDFYKAGAGSGPTTLAHVTRLDPALDAIVPRDATIEKLAEGFLFTEGPVWMPDGYLLFSDPNSNTIYRWSDNDGLSIFRTKSGYTGVDIAEYGQPGSNGLTLDRQGRLTINEHGNRRVTRLEKNGALTILADRYDGKRLNSPNDLVYKSDGSLYFTDPPFGLPKFFDDPRKETPYSGVYRWSAGTLQRLTTDVTGPNGLAFSPDEKHFYVGNWDEKQKIVMRYEVMPDGTLTNGRVFSDMTSAPGEDAIDGLKVDQQGNVYVSGPGGLWILSPAGKHLGTIVGPEHPHNFAWGDADGKTLYLTAQTGLYRIRLGIAGTRPLTVPTN